MDAARSGSLSDTPFPLLLVDLYSRGLTGCLEVTERAHAKRVYIDGGRVIFAASTSRNDRLGEMLLRRGELRLADYARAASSIVPGKRFGTVLVEAGIFTPHQLVLAVKEQVKEIVFSLFPVSGADWAFSDKQEARDEIIKLTINTPELIKQGIQRVDRVDLALAALGDAGRSFSLTLPLEDVEESLALLDWEKRLARRLASPQRLESLMGDPERSDFEALRLLWTLLTLRMIAPYQPAAGEVEAEVPEELEICGEDLIAIGGKPASAPEPPPATEGVAPPSEEESAPPGMPALEAEIAACTEALSEVTQILKGELGTSAFAFVSQAFEKVKLGASGAEIPPLRLQPTLEWTGALSSSEHAAFVRRFLASLRGQVDALLPGPVAEALAAACERAERT